MYIYYNNYIDMYSGYKLIYGMELTIDDIILLFDLEEDYYEEEENIFLLLLHAKCNNSSRNELRLARMISTAGAN